MSQNPSDILFSKAVREMQFQQDTYNYIDRLIERDHWKNQLTGEQMQFIRQRDSFYLATATAEGRPYMQHRGGPKGFIQVPNTSSLRFPDFGGNRQYITTGNLSENSKAFLFFMDYQNQRRLKLWGRASVHSKDSFPLTGKQLPERAKVERIIHFEIEALDENCQQHIQKRYSDSEYEACKEKLLSAEQKIETLEKKIHQLEH